MLINMFLGQKNILRRGVIEKGTASEVVEMIDIIETEAIRKRMIAMAVINIPEPTHGGLMTLIQLRHHQVIIRESAMKVIKFFIFNKKYRL